LRCRGWRANTLRWTGDEKWLDKEVGGVKVLDRLVTYAENWRKLDTNKHGLADYGGVTNLLEAVSSYVHEVAGLNAANVYNLRFAADLLEHRGQKAKATAMRKEATIWASGCRSYTCPEKAFGNVVCPTALTTKFTIATISAQL
jgi:hypothetical protein